MKTVRVNSGGGLVAEVKGETYTVKPGRPVEVADDVADELLALASEYDVDLTDEDPSSGPTLKELRERASELDVEGRSSMSKDELAEAVADAEAELAA